MTQYDDISMLPPVYQEQVRKKLLEREKKPSAGEISGPMEKNGEKRTEKTKYGNRKTEAEGIRFDSKKEAGRFLTLRDMERRGEISDLRLQVNFTLIEGYTKSNGERVRPEIYRADFTYFRKDETGRYTIYIVEDVKSMATRTKTYRIKQKQLREKFGLEITEI